ncbi:hypothetical protein EJ05DRAFT_484692 [Pseudovirgaria hyperparasitica]|uniref:Uncharacterized protein n=1 Tax=Pseudovirgaria hyperparasitica TaxID=470096 RepID=A0A6A6WAT5_9PEZI|nr:uncharacterized protein EJ05DRAFT_484692 [Pseudovirgaria hyperparasitica]KAF2759783.1 hypothetical protein EJ05DRAFT_484692 [Pseudovirgaria hyperparasitica]
MSCCHSLSHTRPTVTKLAGASIRCECSAGMVDDSDRQLGLTIIGRSPDGVWMQSGPIVRVDAVGAIVCRYRHVPGSPTSYGENRGQKWLDAMQDGARAGRRVPAHAAQHWTKMVCDCLDSGSEGSGTVSCGGRKSAGNQDHARSNFFFYFCWKWCGQLRTQTAQQSAIPAPRTQLSGPQQPGSSTTNIRDIERDNSRKKRTREHDNCNTGRDSRVAVEELVEKLEPVIALNNQRHMIK